MRRMVALLVIGLLHVVPVAFAATAEEGKEDVFFAETEGETREEEGFFAGAEEEQKEDDVFFEERDGAIYYCGDPNYPVWSMGNRVAAVADLSSAYIAEETEKWRLVGFLSFPVVLNPPSGFDGAIPLAEEWRECWFWQKTKTGEFFFYRDGRVGNKVEGAAFARELAAYYALLEAAGMNMPPADE